MTPEIEAGLLERLWADDATDTTVYVILDSARDDRIYEMVKSSQANPVCLYSGSIPEELAKVAPYLVKLQKNDPFAVSMLRDGWGESWGIFFRTTAPMEALRKHFHGLLTVETEEGGRMVFRFYDPRVFNVFLPTCTAAELQAMFGPVHSFMVEDRDSSVLMEYRNQAGSLETERHSLLRAFARRILDEDLTP